MTRPSPSLPLAALVLCTTGCPGDDKGDFECERAAGSPVARGFLGEPGADGCDAGLTCASEPGDAGGTCTDAATAQCVLDGLGEGTGVSKDCAEDEVCVVGSGAWYGACEPWSSTSEVFSGTVDCGADVSTTLDVAQGEVLDLSLTFGVPSDPVPGANISWYLNDQDGTMTYGGNPLGATSYTQDEEVTLSLVHAFQQDAALTWTASIFECNPTSFSGTYERLTGPVTHVANASAMPLAQGETASAVLGCYDQGGDGESQNLHHAYIFEAEAGDVLDLSLSVEAFDGDNPSWTILTLWSADAEVMENGNPVSIDTYAADDASRAYTVTDSGTYYLWLSTDSGDCAVTRYTISY